MEIDFRSVLIAIAALITIGMLCAMIDEYKKAESKEDRFSISLLILVFFSVLAVIVKNNW